MGKRSRRAVMAKYVHIIAPIDIRVEHSRLQKRANHASIRQYVQNHVTVLQISGLNRIVVHVLVSAERERERQKSECGQNVSVGHKARRTSSQRGVCVMCIVNIWWLAVVMGVRAVPVLCIYSRYVKLNYAVGFCEENPRGTFSVNNRQQWRLMPNIGNQPRN